MPVDSPEYHLGRLAGAVEALTERVSRAEHALVERIDGYRAEGRADRQAMREDLGRRLDAVGAELGALSVRVAAVEAPSDPPPPPESSGPSTAVQAARIGIVAATLPYIGPVLAGLLLGAATAHGCAVQPTAGHAVGAAAASAGVRP